MHRNRKVVRIIFGNPQIAITMIRHDVGAALFVPVEVLIVEREDGRTDVVQGENLSNYLTLVVWSEGMS